MDDGMDLFGLGPRRFQRRAARPAGSLSASFAAACTWYVKICHSSTTAATQNITPQGRPAGSCPPTKFRFRYRPRNPNIHSFAYVVIILFFLLLTPNSELITNSYAETTNFGKAESKIEIAPAKKTLRVGEKFVYGVYWMGINVGEGILEVKELTKVNGKEAYHIVATAKSNDFLSTFYKVEDVLHSYIDKNDLCTLRFEKHQREGRYKSDEIIIFDQEKHEGYYESLLNKKKKEFNIPPNVHDIPSAFYYFRTLDVKPNSKITLDVNADEKNWKVDMNVMDTETLEILRKGVHKVFCVEPKAPFKGVISKRSKAWVYFSVDENRVPLYIKIRIPFGFIVGVLEKAE